MVFVFSSPFLPILFLTSFVSNTTEKGMHFTVFSPKQSNCPSYCTSSSFMIKVQL